MKKEGQTEEYRRQLRERHMLEYVCLCAAVLMVVFLSMYLLQGQPAGWMLKAVVLLGGVMNLGLAVRAALQRIWLGALPALLLALGCAGLLVYVQVIR